MTTSIHLHQNTVEDAAFTTEEPGNSGENISFQSEDVGTTERSAKCFPSGWRPIARETKHDELNIHPGIFQFRTQMVYDTESLQKRKALLLGILEEEHENFRNIVKNIIAMINYKIPSQQKEARLSLESLRENFPNNLNTLANLEILYRSLHLKIDADKCKQKIQGILDERENPISMRERAICLLEQGYTFLFEKFYSPFETARMKVQEAYATLSQTTYTRSSEQDNKKIIAQIREVCKSFSSIKEQEERDSLCRQQLETVELFERGIQMLEKSTVATAEEIILWKYFLAMAYKRLHDFFRNANALDINGSKDEMIKRSSSNLVLVFADIIHALDIDNAKHQLYIARAYAYIGQFLYSHEECLDTIKDRTLRNKFDDIEKALKYASTIKQDDPVVLVRYARILYYKSQKISDEKTRATFLKKVEDLLSKVVDKSPERWFLFETRMDVRLEISKVTHDPEEKNSYMEHAYTDSSSSIEEKQTEYNLTKHAKICQNLAKYPKEKCYGPEHIESSKVHYLNSAIERLNEALRLGGLENIHTTFTLASCLFDKGEFRNAAEWMKRAMMLSDRSKGQSFLLTCVYLLRIYKENKKEFIHLFYEMLLVAQTAKTKFPQIDSTMRQLLNREFDTMYELIRSFSSEDHRLRPGDLEILNMLLQQSPKLHRFKSIFNDRQPLDGNREASLEFPFVSSKEGRFSLPTENKSIASDSYIYDFFLCHSSEDSGSVAVWLLKQLENRLDPTDVPFTGCFADRDFIAGKPIITNIQDAITNSYKILMILTPNFVKSRWCEFELKQALQQSLDQEGREKCIIPILFEEIQECDKPKALKGITHLDMSVPEKFVNGINKLKRRLVREDLECF